jgi:hypothetical protein
MPAVTESEGCLSKRSGAIGSNNFDLTVLEPGVVLDIVPRHLLMEGKSTTYAPLLKRMPSSWGCVMLNMPWRSVGLMEFSAGLDDAHFIVATDGDIVRIFSHIGAASCR